MYHNGHIVWYAVMRDNEDTDHGPGSYVKREAIALAKKYRKSGNPDAYIAVITPEDDFCIDEIRDF